MTNLHMSDALANAMLAQITAITDQDAGAGSIRVYAGSQPANANTALSGQTLLAEFNLEVTGGFGAPSGRSVAIDASPVLTATGLAAGTATWFRMVDDSGDIALDGDVSNNAGSGDLKLNTTTVSVGLDLEITGGTISFAL